MEPNSYRSSVDLLFAAAIGEADAEASIRERSRLVSPMDPTRELHKVLLFLGEVTAAVGRADRQQDDLANSELSGHFSAQLRPIHGRQSWDGRQPVAAAALIQQSAPRAMPLHDGLSTVLLRIRLEEGAVESASIGDTDLELQVCRQLLIIEVTETPSGFGLELQLYSEDRRSSIVWPYDIENGLTEIPVGSWRWAELRIKET